VLLSNDSERALLRLFHHSITTLLPVTKTLRSFLDSMCVLFFIPSLPSNVDSAVSYVQVFSFYLSVAIFILTIVTNRIISG